MNVHLPPELAEFVREQVVAGRYGSEQAVIEQALQLLQERERRLEALREELRPALEELDRGDGIKMNEAELKQFFDKLKAEVRGKSPAGQAVE